MTAPVLAADDRAAGLTRAVADVFLPLSGSARGGFSRRYREGLSYPYPLFE